MAKDKSQAAQPLGAPLKTDRVSLWGVSLMSFCWSVSSLMVFSFLPVFLTEVLHASKTKVGIIEGVAVFTAFAFKVFAGVWSDYIKKRKPIIALGSFLTIIVKPMFAMATSIAWVFAARFIDRLSKGIRSSPTDALIADLSPKGERGRNYGLRQSLYILGEVAGCIIAAYIIMRHQDLSQIISHILEFKLADFVTHSEEDFRLVFWLSTIPAAIALFILIVFVKAPPIVSEQPALRPKWHISHIKYLPLKFWGLLSVASILMVARFSEAFVTLRAKEVGWPVALLPVMLVIMDLVHAGAAYPMGRLADKHNRYKLLLIGVGFLVLGNILMISATNPAWIVLGVIVVGLHMGTTQGLIAALVADSTPSDLRGTAFSLYYLVAGTAVLFGNWLAGHLSDVFGLVGAFRGGLVFSSLACLALWFSTRFWAKPVH